MSSLYNRSTLKFQNNITSSFLEEVLNTSQIKNNQIKQLRNNQKETQNSCFLYFFQYLNSCKPYLNHTVQDYHNGESEFQADKAQIDEILKQVIAGYVMSDTTMKKVKFIQTLRGASGRKEGGENKERINNPESESRPMDGSLEENKKKRISKKRNMPDKQEDIVSTPSKQLSKTEETAQDQFQDLLVHSELVEYVNKLEFLAMNSKAKLQRERKAYSSILSSLALFFGTKGITPEEIESYVSSFVKGMKEGQEFQQEKSFEKLDWIGFLQEKKEESEKKKAEHQLKLQQQLHHSTLLANLQKGNSSIQNGSSNVIRINITGQEENKKAPKQKRSSKQPSQQQQQQANINNIFSNHENVSSGPNNNSYQDISAQQNEPKMKKKIRPTITNEQYNQEVQFPQQVQNPFSIIPNIQSNPKLMNVNLFHQQLPQNITQIQYQGLNDKYNQLLQEHQVNLMQQQMNPIQQMRVGSHQPDQFQ